MIHDSNIRATPFGVQHSLGQVRQLYNNNKPTYHMTDVFGTDTKHLMDNTCSDKASLNMALGCVHRVDPFRAIVFNELVSGNT